MDSVLMIDQALVIGYSIGSIVKGIKISQGGIIDLEIVCGVSFYSEDILHQL